MATARPLERTLQRLKKDGHTAQRVERWQMRPQASHGIRIDLFGCIDVVAIIDNRITGIQCGAMSGHGAHKKKCLAEPRLREWLQAGGGFLIHSWGQMGPAGKRKLWQCRVEPLTLADYQTTPELNLF